MDCIFNEESMIEIIAAKNISATAINNIFEASNKYSLYRETRNSFTKIDI